MISLSPSAFPCNVALTATHMKKLRHGRSVACEVTLCAFGHSFPTPCDECILRKARIRISDLDKGVLGSTVGELLDQVNQFAL